LPTYTMCTLKLPLGVINNLDRARRNCLWRGSDVNCGRTNLNYTGSSTRVLAGGLPRTSNGIILLVCRVTSR
jgi:hypothetical protein